MFFHMVYKSGQIFLPFCHNPRVWQTDGQNSHHNTASTSHAGCSVVKSSHGLWHSWIYYVPSF